MSPSVYTWAHIKSGGDSMNDSTSNIFNDIKIGEDLLSMQNITKIYENGFVANKAVNFTIKKGEIHGLVGENGAGKTTLMKVLFGQEIPEEGEIFLNGKKVQIPSPLAALDYGIGMVHQHFMLVESLTVAENMVLGNETGNGFQFDYKAAIEKSLEVSKKYNLPINPRATIRDLSVGSKQRVEILKMLLHGAEILLLDEPTAVLTPQETRELFSQLKELKNRGFSIVFISHKLNEVKEICDRITVLRSGESVVTTEIENVSESDISRLMVGRDVMLNIQKKNAEPTEVVLKVRDLTSINKFGVHSFKNLNFDLRAGEILGVAGVEGNGQSELANTLAGLDPIQDGDISVNNHSLKEMDIRMIRESGFSIIHEDRMTFGASSNQSISDNLISDRYYKKENKKNGFLDFKKIWEDAKYLIDDFKIKCDGYSANVKTLSGGNIQKVVAAREFTSTPKVLIASQPTRGIDVGAAELIRKKMIGLRDDFNTATLLFSADLSELLYGSDSIMVMYNGEIVAYFSDSSQINEEILGEYMLGLKRQSEIEIGRLIHD